MTEAGNADAAGEVKAALFGGGGTSPAGAYVQFLAGTMRWPVDAHVVQTLSTDTGTGYRIWWLKDRVFGCADVDGSFDPPTVSAAVYPLDSVVRATVDGIVQDNSGHEPTVTARKFTLLFAAGESTTIDPSTFSQWTQRREVDTFIDGVLDALGARANT